MQTAPAVRGKLQVMGRSHGGNFAQGGDPSAPGPNGRFSFSGAQRRDRISYPSSYRLRELASAHRNAYLNAKVTAMP